LNIGLQHLIMAEPCDDPGRGTEKQERQVEAQ
jgi:hypothetical protein